MTDHLSVITHHPSLITYHLSLSTYHLLARIPVMGCLPQCRTSCIGNVVAIDCRCGSTAQVEEGIKDSLDLGFHPSRGACSRPTTDRVDADLYGVRKLIHNSIFLVEAGQQSRERPRGVPGNVVVASNPVRAEGSGPPSGNDTGCGTARKAAK